MGSEQGEALERAQDKIADLREEARVKDLEERYLKPFEAED